MHQERVLITFTIYYPSSLSFFLSFVRNYVVYYTGSVTTFRNLHTRPFRRMHPFRSILPTHRY